MARGEAVSVVLGIGCGTRVDADDLAALARDTMAAGRIASVDCIATLNTKEGEPALRELSRKLAAPLRLFSADTLKTEARVSTPSDLALQAVGTPSVAEAAALAAAGADAKLLVTKRKGPHCTAALAISTSRNGPSISTSRKSESEPA